MQMIAVVPVIRAASATPWAWLPDEKATTPRARSPGESVRSLLSAPRILNAPARWSPSHLKNTRYPLASSNDCDATTGVRWMRPARRRAAALTVSSVSEAAADTTAEIIYSSHDEAPRPARAGRDDRRMLAGHARSHAPDPPAPGADGRGLGPGEDPPARRLGVPLRGGRLAGPRRWDGAAPCAAARAAARGTEEGGGGSRRPRAARSDQQPRRHGDRRRHHPPGARRLEARDRPPGRRRHAGRRRLGRLLRGPRRRHDRGPPDLGDGLDRRHHVQPERRGAHAEGRPVGGAVQIRREPGHGKPVPDAHRRGAKDLPGGHRRSVRAVRCEAGGGAAPPPPEGPGRPPPAPRPDPARRPPPRR